MIYPPRDCVGNGPPGVFFFMANQRALLFIDGSNFYHALKSIGLSTNLNYPEFGRKLVQDRHLVGIRYYVGEVRNDLSRLRRTALQPAISPPSPPTASAGAWWLGFCDSPSRGE